MHAVVCPNCDFIYWVSVYQNWGICTNCGSDNDRWEGIGKPKLSDGYLPRRYAKFNRDGTLKKS